MNTLGARPEAGIRSVASRIDNEAQLRRVKVLRVAAAVSSTLCIALPVCWIVFVLPRFHSAVLRAYSGGPIWSAVWEYSLLLCIGISVGLGLAGIALAAWSVRSAHRRQRALSAEPVRWTGEDWRVLLVAILALFFGLLADGFAFLLAVGSAIT